MEIISRASHVRFLCPFNFSLTQNGPSPFHSKTWRFSKDKEVWIILSFANDEPEIGENRFSFRFSKKQVGSSSLYFWLHRLLVSDKVPNFRFIICKTQENPSRLLENLLVLE
jgi:hypothetical protein